MYKKFFNENSQTEMRDFFLKTIAPLGKIYQYKKGDEIDYFPGEKLGIIVSGKIKVSIYSREGNEKILFFLLPGEIYGEESFVVNHITLIPKAIENTVVSFLDNSILNNYSMKSIEFYKFVFHSVVRKYQIALFQIKDLLKPTPKASICSTLCRLAAQSPQDSAEVMNNFEISFTLTHEELANLVGVSRVTVTRVLKDLKNDEIISIVNKKIYIKDYAKLQQLSEIY